MPPIDADVVARADNHVAAERLVDSINRVRQQPPAAFRIGVWPKQRHELVAAAVQSLRRRQQREESDAVTLRRAASDRTGRRVEHGASKELQTIHMHAGDHGARLRRE